MMDQREGQLQALQQQLQEARDEAEVHLLQWQRVQLELEASVLAQRRQADELATYRQLLQQAESLVDTLLGRLEAGGF
jgi:hypothetical protein